MTHHVAVVAVINPPFCISLQDVLLWETLISNKKLRKLISRGPNFREQNNICRKLCFEGIDAYWKQ